MRVLLIEDSETDQRFTSTCLQNAGFVVDVEPAAAAGLWAAQSGDYDVIALDLMLPDMEGWEALRRLRESGCQTPLMILTGRNGVCDRVRGLREGADDYLCKPCNPDELVARVEALARRGHGVRHARIQLGELVVDTTRRLVLRKGQTLPIPPREYALLEYLAYRPERVVTRREIEAHIYDAAADPMSNVVDAAVYSLRKRIDVPGEPSMIQTRRRIGYVLHVPAAM